MNQFVGIPIELLFSIIGGFGIYIFIDFKKQVKERFDTFKAEILFLEKKLEKIETGEFVEKTVHNVFNSPDFRKDLKDIIKESIISVEKHDKDNLKSSILSILYEIEELRKELR